MGTGQALGGKGAGMPATALFRKSGQGLPISGGEALLQGEGLPQSAKLKSFFKLGRTSWAGGR